MKSRKWFLTINNYTEEEWTKAKKEITKCSYGICCKEVGKKGTPHIHIWLHYKNAREAETIQNKFKRANKMEGKGRDQDQSYLKKDGDFKEYGEMEAPGKRNDLNVIKDVIKGGGSMMDVIDHCSNYQGLRMGELLLKYYEKERPQQKIEVINYYGESGAGKSKAVYKENTEVYRPVSFKWWEGYDGQKVVLIDDWRPEWCSFTELLFLTDLYPFRVECKGGSRQAQFTKIYFTTPKPITEYYEHLDFNTLVQLKRRITKFRLFNRKGLELLRLWIRNTINTEVEG